MYIDTSINESAIKVEKNYKENKLNEKYKQASFKYPKGNMSNEGRLIARKQYEAEKRLIKEGKNISFMGRFIGKALQYGYRIGLFLYNDYKVKKVKSKENEK